MSSEEPRGFWTGKTIFWVLVILGALAVIAFGSRLPAQSIEINDARSAEETIEQLRITLSDLEIGAEVKPLGQAGEFEYGTDDFLWSLGQAVFVPVDGVVRAVSVRDLIGLETALRDADEEVLMQRYAEAVSGQSIEIVEADWLVAEVVVEDLVSRIAISPKGDRATGIMAVLSRLPPDDPKQTERWVRPVAKDTKACSDQIVLSRTILGGPAEVMQVCTKMRCYEDKATRCAVEDAPFRTGFLAKLTIAPRPFPFEGALETGGICMGMVRYSYHIFGALTGVSEVSLSDGILARAGHVEARRSCSGEETVRTFGP
ncbi:hypothetical protein ACN2XU_10015 [Primorskyibacter sp. 2E107]|uniref:hypothetical protein n=1 Tax=Primorskyibacter sp. 2E107 TaxID=3403458 RepID=UPI003AF4A8CE